MRIPLDVVGDIAILKFSRYVPYLYKKYYGWKLLRENKYIKVVLEKTAGFSGELRTQETRWIFGEKRKDTVHRENDCSFYLDVDETYFSSRLSQDRKIMAEEILKSIKQKSKILVMFAGVSPFPIVLAKALKKNNIKAEIISSELNKKACEYGEKNVRTNKVENYVKVFCGDSRKLCDKLATTQRGSARTASRKQRFDFIIMLRPNLEETFLDSALKVAKKNTTIIYHGFGEQTEVENEILRDVKLTKRSVSKLEVRKAGDIGRNKNRFSVKFKVM
jgi:tRNA (guanine37-N1)-methyltransferase